MSESKDNDNTIQIIENLIEFINSTNYITTIQEFFHLNCSGFEEYYNYIKTGQGNKLEWSRLHNEYLLLIETQLELFCNLNNLNSNEIFIIIQNYIQNNNEIEFIPMFLKTTDENYFFEQMYCYSIEKLLIKNVIKKSENEEKGEESMTGIQ